MFEIKNIQNENDARRLLLDTISILHRDGPTDNKIIEKISYLKLFYPEVFFELEEQVISTLGLFYKNPNPNNLLSFILSGVGNTHKKKYNEYLTPVQAHVRNAIESQQYVSISAPTSAGKSFSIRDYINEMQGDCVIVVPSRALIAEYIKSLRDSFKGNKSVMILSFVDYVFTDRHLRRIFVLTPERARELFHSKDKGDIKLFFFDEAQVSEEKERGVIFDVLVRRVKNTYPDAKLIFAHPFVENPSAQFKKHEISDENSFSRSYPHSTVGKVFVFGHKNNKDYYFSPYNNKGYLVENCLQLENKFEVTAFDGTKSVLVFVSKASIYRGDFIDGFSKYIDKFEAVTDPHALKIISQVEDHLGANDTDHRSRLVDLLKKGVVIHHGSIPLDVRFLVEDFIRQGFAKICFATSTLAQGINMPFDIVWLESMRIESDSDDDRALSFKNLIGRSGRLSSEMKFDFGYVYTKSPKLAIERINNNFKLSEESLLDQDVDNVSDEKELISSIKDGTFNDELSLPQTKIERLSTDESLENIKIVLNLFYGNGFGISLFGPENQDNRIICKSALKKIYCLSLGRELYDGEDSVFDNAINIFFQIIQGRSFKEIVGIRYSYISKRGENRNVNAAFSQPANKLPDSKLTSRFSLFPIGTKAKDVSYDAIVFDTYDYLDTVISFSLSDVLIGAMSIYHKFTKDNNALKMIELLKYGTNNSVHTLLLRYGFPPDDVKILAEYVDSISEATISFKDNIHGGPEEVRELVEWYLP